MARKGDGEKSTPDQHPFTEAQQKFLSDTLEGLQRYIGDVEASLDDLGRDFTMLKELLEKKHVIAADEFALHLEKAEEDVRAAKIAMQNRQFFDDLRRRLEQG